MTIKEFVALEKSLLPMLPGFAIRRELMFVSALQHTLRGFCFEGSSFDKTSFYVWAFFLPLCIPKTHISFTFGSRVGAGWGTSDSRLRNKLGLAMQKEAQSLWALQTPEDVIQAIKLRTSNPKSLHDQEALAYMLAWSSATQASLEALGYLLGMLNPVIQWQQEMANRAVLLRDQLLKDPKKARDQLGMWKTETIRNLGLEAFQDSGP